ncbi:MAG: DUF4365 domain-containing protein [Saprospiraceae bacterium]|nr:DUF4365 domain-containing protein [Saprospiraceae bacterium]
MKRPTQHITETISQRIFENLIPVEWVVREIKPDYGIDYLIEVFKSGKSTGITFFVQLKGSEQEIKNDIFEKQFEIDNLKYYSSLSLPVLIVCVSTKTKQTWGIWANKLIKSLNLKPKQETIKLNLGIDNLINAEYFNAIEDVLKVSSRYGLKINTDSDLGAILSSNIANFISHFYQDTFELNNAYLPNHYNLSFFTRDAKHFFTVDGPFFNKEIEIDSIEIEDPLLHRPFFNENDINIANAKILKLLVVAFARENLNGSLNLLKKLIENDYFSSVDDAMNFDPLGILKSSIHQNLLYQFNENVKSLIKKGHYDAFLFFDLSYFALNQNHKDLIQLRTENLKFAIDQTTEYPVKGTCFYNLGNIEKGLFNTETAISHYFKARKFHPDYLNRKHWWRELAGLLFTKGHFRYAELFYKKSIDLVEENIPERYFRLEMNLPNQESIIYALIGDCLLFQCKLSEAKSWFTKFFQNQNSLNTEWVLKDQMLDRFIELGFDDIKIDRKSSLEICEQALNLKDFKQQIIEFKKAIKLNPVNGLAWFNLGVAEDKEKNFQDAFYAFLNTGLLQDGDKEAQFNALLIAFTQEQDILFVLLLQYILEKHGELVINDLSDYFMNKPFPFEAKKMIIEGIVKMTKEMKNSA